MYTIQPTEKKTADCDEPLLTSSFVSTLDKSSKHTQSIPLKLKDPGFVRFRSRSDRTEMFIKKYLKTKKLQHFENPPPIGIKKQNYKQTWENVVHML